MFNQLKCILTFFCSLIWMIDANANKQTTTEEESIELTEPILDLDGLLDIDGAYGVYSTQSFEYVNWQHYHKDEPFFTQFDKNHVAVIAVRCSVDHVKCLSNLEIPAPVCGYYYLNQYPYHRYKVFESYCHVYLENCLLYHRRYRMLNYGGCEMNQYGTPSRWEYPPEKEMH